MDLHTFGYQVAFESASRPEACGLFAYYHPQYQLDCPTYQEDQYDLFTLGDRDYLGESAYYPSSSVSKFRFELDPFNRH
jgi:hypothetical protein